MVKVEDKNLRNLFAQTPEMFCILKGPDHVFEFVNEAHIKALGFDATGQAVRVAQPESVEVHGILDDVYRTGVTAHLHEIPVTLGKGLRYFDLTYAARRDEKNNINGIMILGSEVTNRVLADGKVRKAHEELHLINETVPQVIWTADPKGIPNYINRRWFEFSGSDNPEDWISYVHPQDVDHATSSWTHSVTTGDAFESEFRLRRKDGVYHWFLMLATPIKNDEGDIIKWYGSCTDIEDQKMVVSELEAERESRDQFVSMLSHDLKNPLSAATMSAQIINRVVDQPDKVAKLTSRIIDNLGRANKMIENLLDANKIKAGVPLQLNIEEMGLKTLVEDVLIDLGTVHGDRFVLKSSCDVINGFWSPDGIRRMLENLCNNAVKYGDDRTPIEIRLDEAHGIIKIVVHNYGNPISEEDQKKLFDPYERTVNVAQGTVTGWGLGLTLVRGVAEAHKGKVEVNSRQEHGTTFTVELPVDSR